VSCYVVKKTIPIILSCNVPEIEEGITVFVPSSSYELKDEVQMGQDIFKSLKADNQDIPVPKTTTLSWRYLRKTNRHRAFDEYNSTITTYQDKIEYVVESRYIDTIALFKLKATSVKIELFNIDDDTFSNSLSTQEFDTVERDVHNYTSYITAQGEYQDILVSNLFPYFDTKLRITISNPSKDAEVGNIIYGRKYDLGLTLIDPQPTHELKNLYETTIDEETGTIQQVPILPTESGTISVIIPTNQIDRTKNILKKFMGEAHLWIAIQKNKKLPNLVFYGFYQRITTPIGLQMTTRNIEITGVP